MSYKSSATKPSPPSNAEAESGVLSCLLREGDEGGDPSEKLSELAQEDFCDLRNRGIFLKLQQLSGAGKPIQLESLVGGNNDEQLGNLGGREYILLLAGEVPDRNLWSYYLRELRDASKRRARYQLGQELMQSAKTSTGTTDQQIDVLLARAGGLQIGKGRLPPTIDAAHLIETDIPAPPELIGGMLHKGSKMVVAGSSKSYKTHILLDLAVSVSSGIDFWGMPTTKSKVLFINLELQESFMCKRILKISNAKEMRLYEGMLDIWNLRGHTTDISKLKSDMLPGIRRSKPGMIILDPIYKIMGERDENSVSHITSMMNELESIAVETGAAIVFGNHFSKGNQARKQSIDRISGSGAFARDPDAILTLTRHDEEDCFTVDTTLRNFPPLSPFVVRWDYPLMLREDGLDPEQLRQTKCKPAKHHTIEEILAHVPREGSIDKNQLRTNANKAGIAQNKINPLINEAIDEEKLHEWRQPRPGTNPRKLISRKPQPEDTLLTCTT